MCSLFAIELTKLRDHLQMAQAGSPTGIKLVNESLDNLSAIDQKIITIPRWHKDGKLVQWFRAGLLDIFQKSNLNQDAADVKAVLMAMYVACIKILKDYNQ